MQDEATEDPWLFAPRWERLTADVQKLGQHEQRQMVERFEQVLDGQHVLVALQEPEVKMNVVGRPSIKKSRKRKRFERAAKSMRRDPCAYEVVEEELRKRAKTRKAGEKKAGSPMKLRGKKRGRPTTKGGGRKKKVSMEEEWCLICKHVGHLRDQCPKGNGALPTRSVRRNPVREAGARGTGFQDIASDELEQSEGEEWAQVGLPIDPRVGIPC